MSKGNILLEALLCFMIIVLLSESVVLLFVYGNEPKDSDPMISKWDKDCLLTCVLETALP